ncbi:MAG: hypothetical protein ACK5TH_23825 [Prosthecobacter sp.]|jgi:hypothetical protein
MKSTLLCLLMGTFLASCSSRSLILSPDPGTPGIILPTQQVAEHKWGKVTFPAGLYLPEAKSEKGIYYAAPERVNTDGMLRGGREHGGLFIQHGTGYQYLWIGQPGYQLQQAPGTIMGQWGVETPLLYTLKERVQIQPVGKR